MVALFYGMSVFVIGYYMCQRCLHPYMHTHSHMHICILYVDIHMHTHTHTHTGSRQTGTHTPSTAATSNPPTLQPTNHEHAKWWSAPLQQQRTPEVHQGAGAGGSYANVSAISGFVIKGNRVTEIRARLELSQGCLMGSFGK